MLVNSQVGQLCIWLVIHLFSEEANGFLSMVFHFELMSVDQDKSNQIRYDSTNFTAGKTKWHHQPWSLRDIKQIMSSWQVGLANTGSVVVLSHFSYIQDGIVCI